MITKFDFIRVATAVPEIKVADCDFNKRSILNLILKSEEKGADLIVFPELTLTGVTCGDLFTQTCLLNESLAALSYLLEKTKSCSVAAIVGLPLWIENGIYNTAAVIQQGKIAGLIPKTQINSSRGVFDARWFNSSTDLSVKEVKLNGVLVPVGEDLLFSQGKAKYKVTINEDKRFIDHSELKRRGVYLVVNLSSSVSYVGSYLQRREEAKHLSQFLNIGYLEVSSGLGESSTDGVYDGLGLVFEQGFLLSELERFSTESVFSCTDVDIEKIKNNYQCERLRFSGTVTHLERVVDLQMGAKKMELVREVNSTPFLPAEMSEDAFCSEAFTLQTMGLVKRLKHINFPKVVVGMSGGLDSTLALIACIRTFDYLKRSRKEIIGVTMPGFGTTGRTYKNAMRLMEAWGITVREISIKEACNQHFKDIGHAKDLHDVTYENAQARERTQVLMDIANQVNGIVIGTGDLSELALGWATYNGDHMSMYSLNGSIPKTMIQHMVRWYAQAEENKTVKELLLDVVATPISPELTPASSSGEIQQKTENLVGPYELHDFFIYHFLQNSYRPAKIFFLAKHAFQGVYTEEVIKHWLVVFLKRFFAQQFKRSCLPDGPKVTSISISPRTDWKMASDSLVSTWLKDLE